MALRFIRESESGDGFVATRRLCRTEDGRLVPDTDPAARWLFCVPGMPIKRADAEQFGLLDAPAPAVEPESEPEAKKAPAPANKARRSASNKGA